MKHLFLPFIFAAWLLIVYPLCHLVLFSKGYSISKIFWNWRNSWVGLKRRRPVFGSTTLIERHSVWICPIPFLTVEFIKDIDIVGDELDKKKK